MYWAFSVIKYFSVTIFKDTIVFSYSCTITYPFLSGNLGCFLFSTTIDISEISTFLHRSLCTSGNFRMACPSHKFSFLIRSAPASPLRHPPTPTGTPNSPCQVIFLKELTTSYILHVYYLVCFFPWSIFPSLQCKLHEPEILVFLIHCGILDA